MIDLKTKTVMIVDNGLFTEFARVISRGFKKAYYYMPWASAFVHSRNLTVGVGFPELERVRAPLALEGVVDLWVFLDIFHADLQEHLVKSGARVWGARWGEELELYRWETKQVLRRIGLPTLPAKHIIGMKALRSHLQTHKDKWIKNSFNNGGRADQETWHHENYDLSEPRLDQLEYDLGALKHVYEFIVEDSYPDSVEIGYDGWSVDGLFPSVAMTAYEVKGVGMIGTLKRYEQFPKPVRDVNEKLAPELKGYGYRGFLCTEIRYGKEKKPYLIDPCARLGSPSNELLQCLIGNWPEIIWQGAGGVRATPRPLFKYGAVAMAYSEQSAQSWQALHYPESIEQYVKMRNPTIIQGQRYAVPQGQPQNIAGIVGVGNTLESAIQMMVGNAKQVKGDRVTIELGSIDKALDVIEQGRKYGIQFTSDSLPDAETLRAMVKE